MGWAKATAVAGAVVAAQLRGSHGVVEMTCFSRDLDLGDECANFADCCPGESQCILGEGEDFPTCQVCNLEDGPCQVVDCLGGLTPQEPFDTRGFADQHGKLRLDGVQLVDENGEPVVLIGIDSRWVLEERACFDRGSIENAAVNFGANLVVAKFYAGNGLVLTGAADSVTVLQDVKTIVDICKDLGIYVMIVFQAGQDLNDPRIVDPRNFLDDTQGGTAQVFWDQVANEFKDESHVIYNIAGQFDGSDLTWEDILVYHNTIIGRIRNIDADTIIIAATRTFNQNLDEVSQSPVDLEDNVMYSVMFSGTEESVGLVLNRILPAISKPLFVLSWVASSHDGTFGPDLLNTKRVMDLITGKTNQLQGIKLSWSSFAFSDLGGPVNSIFPPGTCSNRRFDELTCAGVFVQNLMLSESRLQNGDEVDGDNKALVTIVGVAIGLVSLALIGGAFVVKKRRRSRSSSKPIGTQPTQRGKQRERKPTALSAPFSSHSSYSSTPVQNSNSSALKGASKKHLQNPKYQVPLSSKPSAKSPRSPRSPRSPKSPKPSRAPQSPRSPRGPAEHPEIQKVEAARSAVFSGPIFAIVRGAFSTRFSLLELPKTTAERKMRRPSIVAAKVQEDL